MQKRLEKNTQMNLILQNFQSILNGLKILQKP